MTRRPAPMSRSSISNGCDQSSGSSDRRAERAGGREELRLGEVERVRAFDVACGDVVADRRAEQLTVRVQHECQLRFGHSPRGIGADADRRAGADGATAACVLQEQLGTLGVVDEAVHVARLDPALVDASVAAPLVRDAGGPRLGRDEGQRAARTAAVARVSRRRAPRSSVPVRSRAPRSTASTSSLSSSATRRRRVGLDEAEARLVVRLSEADDADQ